MAFTTTIVENPLNLFTVTFNDNNAGTVIDANGSGILQLDGQTALPFATAALLVGEEVLGKTVVGVFNGNGGDDTILAFSTRANTINGGNGNDSLTGGALGDTINGGNGADFLDGLGGNDVLNGGNGGDLLWGFSGNDTLNGDAGNDDLFGESGNDTLNGGDGNDFMSGGTGSDTLNGGEGNDRYAGDQGRDVFAFTSANSQESDELDRILDWNRGRDQIDLTGVTGLASIEVLVTGGTRVDMLLLNRVGDTIQTIDISATSQAGRNILLQESAYGDGANSRVLTNADFDPSVDLVVII